MIYMNKLNRIIIVSSAYI